jgi:hypothetical protein
VYSLPNSMLKTEVYPASTSAILSRLLRLPKRLAEFEWLFIRPSHRCLNFNSSVPPLQIKAVCCVLLGSWPHWPARRRDRRCGS